LISYSRNKCEHEYEDTYCPNCGHRLIDRKGFYIVKMDLDGDRCPECGYKQNIPKPLNSEISLDM
jgi:pyruvate formate lyase activating enzyme